ncbi:MAG: phenylalanine--tRNA ligase subunit beta [Desulfobacterales bacterium]|nr:phenylalanine--tRNA ligase subunit beta [Desulfobacterales bacterium]
MRVSLNWLKEYVDIELSPQDLADLLSMSGLEVEALEPLGQSLREIVAARIVSIKPHPDADRLSVCQVDTGKRQLQVVCGAPNLEQGGVVPMALPGTKLPGGTTVLESVIRGERSVGMLLAEAEMGLTEDHSGIMILPSSLEPGAPVAESLSLEDWCLDIALTPNRSDCASVIGIAREIAALTGQRLRKQAIEIKEGPTSIRDLSSVTLEDSKGCPRYAAGMIRGVELKPSPFWLRYRLHVSGVRSISNVVDATNYVLLEMGQPLHAFDFDRLKEHRIIVRRAKEGDRFTTLDGKTHALNEENLMICDGQRPVALAGVMGGLNSEIFADSKNVLIESAFFDPVTTRRGSKRLGLSTEASYRFERGVDIEGVLPSLQRALTLLGQLAGGEIMRGVIDEYPRPYQAPVINLGVEKTNRFLGTKLSRDAIGGYLKALEMEVQTAGEDMLRVIPPTFRVDITRDWDLMEEVARLEGFENIPVTFPPIKPSEEADLPELVLSDKIREIMTGLGFAEIISYSFISPESADLLGAEEKNPLRSFVSLLNPLSSEQSVMRTSLIPGILTAVKTNFSYGENDLKLFEWGRIFIRSDADELPHERPMLSAVMTGMFNRNEWYREERRIDFYDVKGAVSALLKALGLQLLQFKRGQSPPWYQPDASSAVYLPDGTLLGTVGQVSQEVMGRLDLEDEWAFVFELDGRALLERALPVKKFEPLAKFPAALRYISILVDRNIESDRIKEIIEREGGDLIESVTLFDLYEGGKIGTFEKALAFRVCYRSREGTLDGKEVNQRHETVIRQIGKETGGRLRES